MHFSEYKAQYVEDIFATFIVPNKMLPIPAKQMRSGGSFQPLVLAGYESTTFSGTTLATRIWGPRLSIPTAIYRGQNQINQNQPEMNVI